MYFNPPQNNHNDFYHPLNQVNEEKHQGTNRFHGGAERQRP